MFAVLEEWLDHLEELAVRYWYSSVCRHLFLDLPMNRVIVIVGIVLSPFSGLSMMSM